MAAGGYELRRPKSVQRWKFKTCFSVIQQFVYGARVRVHVYIKAVVGEPGASTWRKSSRKQLNTSGKHVLCLFKMKLKT